MTEKVKLKSKYLVRESGIYPRNLIITSSAKDERGQQRILEGHLVDVTLDRRVDHLSFASYERLATR